MRLTGQSELLKPVARWIDDMTVVYSVHDTPTALLGWDHRQDLSDHVEEGECECFRSMSWVTIHSLIC